MSEHVALLVIALLLVAFPAIFAFALLGSLVGVIAASAVAAGAAVACAVSVDR